MPLGYVNFFKSCALPPSLLFYALFLSPVWAHDVASTIFWRDNSENSWPLGEKYCIISSPSIYSGLHLPCFLQHVQQWHLSVNPLRWETGTQCLLEVHLLVVSLQGQLGFQGQCLPLWELALQAIWALTLTTLILKLQTYPLDQISTTLLWNIWSVAFYQFVLKPLTNSYSQDPAPL